MIMPLFKWNQEQKDIEIGDINDISLIEMIVVSGDEICKITYKDGTYRIFDSAEDRALNYYDQYYIVFDLSTNINLLLFKPFVLRNSSYWYDKCTIDELKDEKVRFYETEDSEWTNIYKSI